MYHVKMAFALVQVGTNLWVNPMQVQGIQATGGTVCQTLIITATPINSGCSDWSIEKVKEALAPAAVSTALEGK